jgi:hypothetical protein
MTNDQINKAIATELGWKPFCCTDDYLWTMIDSAGCHAGRNYRGGLSEDHCWAVCNLDFTTDHNAVAEMRKAINCINDRARFFEALLDVLDQTTCDWAVFDATPRQQAEAFLRMRGKWVA